uniref:Uncharacterized protein n=1 Tax=Macaca nemestrina TaxID=9545 RepID=A0A2K6E785_MACNE
MLVNGENFGVSLNYFPIKESQPSSAGLKLTALSSEYQSPAEGGDNTSSLQRGASAPAATSLRLLLSSKDSLGSKCRFPCFRDPGVLIT